MFINDNYIIVFNPFGLPVFQNGLLKINPAKKRGLFSATSGKGSCFIPYFGISNTFSSIALFISTFFNEVESANPPKSMVEA